MHRQPKHQKVCGTKFSAADASNILFELSAADATDDKASEASAVMEKALSAETANGVPSGDYGCICCHSEALCTLEASMNKNIR